MRRERGSRNTKISLLNKREVAVKMLWLKLNRSSLPMTITILLSKSLAPSPQVPILIIVQPTDPLNPSLKMNPLLVV